MNVKAKSIIMENVINLIKPRKPRRETKNNFKCNKIFKLQQIKPLLWLIPRA